MTIAVPSTTPAPATVTVEPVVESPQRPSAQEVLAHLSNVGELHREARTSLRFMDAARARKAMAMATQQLVPCWVALEPLLPPRPLNLAGQHQSRVALDAELPEPEPWQGPVPYATNAPRDLVDASPGLDALFERLRTQVTDVTNPLKAGPPLDRVGDAFEVLARSHMRAAFLVARLPESPVLNALAARRRADPIAVAYVRRPRHPQEIPAGLNLGEVMRAHARDVFAVLVATRPITGGIKVLDPAERRLWQELDLVVPDLVERALAPMQADHVLRDWKPREVESLHDAIRAARDRR